MSSFSDFDPNGVAHSNGNFLGFPSGYEESDLILYPVPWDVTVSYHEGTAEGPENIIRQSEQLEAYHPWSNEAWRRGIFFTPPSEEIVQNNDKYRNLAVDVIQELENGKTVQELSDSLEKVNRASEQMNTTVYQETLELLNQGKIVGLLGGDHSTPLGYYRALSEKRGDFGILHFDAHMDLRRSYEGFDYSHASIFYNTLSSGYCSSLHSVGIRDFCLAEAEMAHSDDRIRVWYQENIDDLLLRGANMVDEIDRWLEGLPDQVYISFDIDALDPTYCPHTGTPVPGGLSYSFARSFFRSLIQSNKEIIGFDLCEVNGHHDYDGNVGARIAFELMMLCLAK